MEHGSEDTLILPQWAERDWGIMRKAGANLTERMVPGLGHAHGDYTEALQWLKSKLSVEKSDTQ